MHYHDHHHLKGHFTQMQIFTAKGNSVLVHFVLLHTKTEVELIKGSKLTKVNQLNIYEINHIARFLTLLVMDLYADNEGKSSQVRKCLIMRDCIPTHWKVLITMNRLVNS